MKRLFCEHPASVGETYFQHLGSAISFSVSMFAGALCCLIHAVFPFAFQRTGSAIIGDLHDRMIANRARK